MTTALLALACGVGFGVGILLTAAGLCGRQVLPRPWQGRRGRQSAGMAERGHDLAAAAGAGLVVWLAAGWVGASVLAACGAAVLARLVRGQRQQEAWITRSEAIASWTEMLRDAMGAADGIQDAIAATVGTAPRPLQDDVALLDARCRGHLSLPAALAAFAEKLEHPTSDLVAIGLIAAVDREHADQSHVVTVLATLARSEAAMYREVAATRAQLDALGRLILAAIAATAATAAGWILLRSTSVPPYGQSGGRVALVLVTGLVAAGFVTLYDRDRIRLTRRWPT